MVYKPSVLSVRFGVLWGFESEVLGFRGCGIQGLGFLDSDSQGF